MEHSEPEILAMIALDDPEIPAGDLAHLRTCAACRADVDSLRRVAALARGNSSLSIPLESPSPAVWERITEELSLPSAVAAEREVELRTVAAMRPASSRLRRRAWVAALALAASLALLIGVGGAVTLLRPIVHPAPTVVATAQLKPFPKWAGASGEAVVEKSATGQRELVVKLAAPATEPGFREVWVMSSSLTKLVSIGVLSDGEGRFAVPADLNLADFPVVDISEEPLDGNPAHSGNSIVRGKLS